MVSSRPRAFVMVVVLAIVAVIVTVLGAMLAAREQNKKVTLRQIEDTKARGIAEMCLSKGVAVAIAHFQQRGGEDFDFDQLLDPDQNPTSGDEYVFNEVGATRQHIPPTNTDALHRYSFVRVDGGACYIRYDDNNDDSLPGYSAQTGNTPNGGIDVDEGAAAGRNVPFRDRDASIQVTAVGVFPAFADTPDGDVYGRAHARVTMRQYFTAAASPAIYGNGNVSIAGNVEICGSGGVRGLQVTVDTTSCICGDAFVRALEPDGIGECTPATTRCPDGAAGAFNDPATFPLQTGTDFPTRCATFGITEGEDPAAVIVDDPVAGQNYRPREYGPVFGNLVSYRNPECRFFLRNDGAVFLWDGRQQNDALRDTVVGTRCDELGDPPTFTAGQKDAVCTAVQTGSSCTITTDNDRDQEFCDFGTDAGAPTVRCDRLDTVPWPPPVTPAQKDAVCQARMTSATCAQTPDPTDTELCVPPNAGVACAAGTLNMNTVEGGDAPLPLAGWTAMTMPISAVDALPNGGSASAQCWRMVADLDGVVEVADGAGSAVTAALAAAPEWELGGDFAITSPFVPNLRPDPNLEVRDAARNLVPPRIEDVCSFRHVTTASAGANPVNHPILVPPRPIASRVGGAWSTPANWRNEEPSDRRLLTPAAFIVQGDLTIGPQTHLDGVTFSVIGNATVAGGGGANGTVLVAADTLGHRTTSLEDPVRYAGRLGRCTREVSDGPILAAWDSGPVADGYHRSIATRLMPAVAGLVPAGPVTVTSRFALRADGDCTFEDEVSVFGKVACAGDIRVAGAESCFDGGLSAGGGDLATFAPDCNAGPVSSCGAGDTGLCLEQQTAVVGDVFSREDVTMPHGVFISQSTTHEKVGRVISVEGDICVNGPARIVGQVVSERTGGDIQIGNDVLFLHSGEVGFGFGTRRSVWTDNSW